MRLVLSGEGVCDHFSSGKCERCLPNIVEGKREGYCILEQEEDGSPFVTLVMMEGGKGRTFIVPEDKVGVLEDQTWSGMMEALVDFEVTE